ncbi:hypothetical protein [Mucilaginibacter sp.]|uniref:hypothetical protein n=1 Tax=Mucilaginibacter sp. TaxID=1882438 RepID=UPI002625D67D|nr:hypothetical protein [Mucilaginibacter sp.]
MLPFPVTSTIYRGYDMVSSVQNGIIFCKPLAIKGTGSALNKLAVSCDDCIS